jgi:hypothetical protein
MMVIHVVVNPRFSVLKSNGMTVAGERRRRDTSGRCGSRGGTDRGQQRDATGVDTSEHQRVEAVARSRVSRSVPPNGLVRQASDLDYRLVVARDYCADPDPEVHAMLLAILTAKQVTVVTTAEFASALPGRSS